MRRRELAWRSAGSLFFDERRVAQESYTEPAWGALCASETNARFRPNHGGPVRRGAGPKNRVPSSVPAKAQQTSENVTRLRRCYWARSRFT